MEYKQTPPVAEFKIPDISVPLANMTSLEYATLSQLWLFLLLEGS